MKHFIKDNIYYITNNDEVLLKIKLENEKEGNQIIVKTKKEVYAGPIELILFKEDI